MANRCVDCGNFMEDRDLDNLDHAQALLDNLGQGTDPVRMQAFSTKALAHIQLWYANLHREHRRQQEEWSRAQAQLKPPPPVMPYSGTF